MRYNFNILTRYREYHYYFIVNMSILPCLLPTFLFTASISVKYYSSYNKKNYVNFNLGFKANATPGIYPPQYTSQASNLAPGQTLDPPPNAPYPSHNGCFTPQPPPYGEPAPSYDSMFGPPGNKAPPYPTSQNEPNFVPPPAKN